MKKRAIIYAVIVIAVVLAILFVPFSSVSYDDGGTREFRALICKYVKWNRYYNGDLCYATFRVYLYPDNRKSIDDLWLEIDNNSTIDDNGAISPNFQATVIEIDEKTITVKPHESTREYSSSDKIIVPKTTENFMIADNPFDDIQVGDVVNIVYDGLIMETYPAQLSPIYALTILEKSTEQTEPATEQDDQQNSKDNESTSISNGNPANTTTKKDGSNSKDDNVNITFATTTAATTTVYADWFIDGNTKSDPDIDFLPYQIEGKVVDIAKNNSNITIDVSGGSYENLPGKVVVNMDFSDSGIKAGDTVVVYYDGIMLETYPSQINNIYRVHIIQYK